MRFIQIINLESSDLTLRAAADLVGGLSILLTLTDPSSSGKTAGPAWKNYLNLVSAGSPKNETEAGLDAVLLVLLLVYGAFVDAALIANSGLPTSLKSVGLGWLGTWREINIRLAGQLYRYGLQLSRNRNDEAAATTFQAALQCWTVVEMLDTKSSPSQRRTWRGMRAVVRLFFARRMENPEIELKLAVEDFEQAEFYGDHTAEHFAMRAESHIRLFAQTADDAQLASADSCLALAKGEGHHTAELLAARGQIFFCRGLRAMVAAGARSSVGDDSSSDVSSDLPDLEITTADEDKADRFSRSFDRNSLLAAANAFTSSALWHSRSALTSTGGLRNPQVPIIQRGQAWLRAAHARRLLGLSYTRQVAAAVADLSSCAEAAAPISGPYWPWSLLEEARLLIRQDTEDALHHAHRSVGEALRYADKHLEPQGILVSRLQALDIEILLRLAIVEGNISQIRLALPLALIDDEDTRVPVTPLIYAARLLVSNANSGENPGQSLSMDDRHLIRKVVDYIAKAANQSEKGALRFMASHAATLLTLCDGIGPIDDCELDVLRRIYSLARLAYDTDPETADYVQLSQLARAATRYARSVLRSATDDCRQTALELFDEAISAYTRITNFDSKSAHSGQKDDIWLIDHDKEREGRAAALFFHESQHASLLGDAYLRRHSLRRDPGDLRTAINWLEHAIATGNETPDNSSLLGEALIRLGRRERNVDALRRGFQLKTANRVRGLYSRESLSVAAAAAAELWNLTRDSSYYEKAVQMAAYAATVDPGWPWPLLQLAEFAEVDQGQRHLLPSSPPNDQNMPDIPVELWENVRSGETKRLIALACSAAARSKEFASLILGGRNKVYVLDDPHGLLSASLVLKPRKSRRDAENELIRVSDFASYLSTVNAPWWAATIQPLAVVESAVQGMVIAVSRRERGRVLSSLLSDEIGARSYLSAGALSRTIETYRRVLTFLAIIHSWRGIPRPEQVVESRQLLSKSLLGNLRALGVRDPERGCTKWYDSIPEDLPLVGKRDAHSDNWLVTDSGRIVAVDLEATSFLPVGFEVAQLLEDMPLLPVNEEGMSYRKSLASTYLSELSRRMPKLAQSVPDAGSDTWRVAYACFAARRAVFLLSKFARKLPPDASSSAAIIAQARVGHARSLLRWAFSVVPELAWLYPADLLETSFGDVA